MKRLLCLPVLLCATMMARAEDAPQPPATTQPATRPAYIDDISYGVGFQIGKQIQPSPIPLNQDQIFEGIRDAIAGKEAKVKEAAFQKATEQFQKDAEARAREQGEKNVKEGDAYRAENGKKQGVKTTESGLQIETIKEGTGESPKATDTVKVNYTGTLVNGTKFDASADHGGPATFGLNRVIKGWGEGLQQMKVGGKSRLVVPPGIGYGERGGPGGPNATLIFEVELLDIVKQPEQPAMPGMPGMPQQ